MTELDTKTVEDIRASLPADSPLLELTTPAGKTDPYPAYRRMRAGHDLGVPGVVFLTRYADCVAVLRHAKVSSDDRRTPGFQALAASGVYAADQLARLDRRTFIHLDPPDHTRLRRLVGRVFTPQVVAGMRLAVQRLVDGALDRAGDGGGEMELIAELAYPLPVRVICDLIGIPAEDHLDAAQWARPQLCCNLDPSAGLGPGTMAETGCMQDQLDSYLERLIEQRRAHPRDDLISALIATTDAGDALSTAELVATVRLLFVGGHETTVSLIANGMLALLRNPGQLDLLRHRPELTPQAVEEVLRYDAPFQFVRRHALDDLEIGGSHFPRGTVIYAILAAANRDPDHFADPDRFDITRTDNRHLAFGAGIHACLGVPLARMQSEIALRALTERLADPRLGADPPPYHDNAVHAIKSLPVRSSAVRPASAVSR